MWRALGFCEKNNLNLNGWLYMIKHSGLAQCLTKWWALFRRKSMYGSSQRYYHQYAELDLMVNIGVAYQLVKIVPTIKQSFYGCVLKDKSVKDHDLQHDGMKKDWKCTCVIQIGIAFEFSFWVQEFLQEFCMQSQIHFRSGEWKLGYITLKKKKSFQQHFFV